MRPPAGLALRADAGDSTDLWQRVPRVQFNGKDFTDDFIALANWENNQLPGDWDEEGGLEGMTLRRMTANPLVFGVVPMSVRSISDEDDRLEAIEVVYLDAGEFFGYRPGGDDAVAAARDSIEARKRHFAEIYTSFDEEIMTRLKATSESEGRPAVIGKTRFLRGRSLDFVKSGFALRYQKVAENGLRLTIVRQGNARNHYLDNQLEDMDRDARAAWFRGKVERKKSGDVVISGVPVFRQGVRPYCAISTLGMVTHYLGLRISVEGLASAAGFRNDGTAGGTKLLELYAASPRRQRCAVRARENSILSAHRDPSKRAFQCSCGGRTIPGAMISTRILPSSTVGFPRRPCP